MLQQQLARNEELSKRAQTESNTKKRKFEAGNKKKKVEFSLEEKTEELVQNFSHVLFNGNPVNLHEQNDLPETFFLEKKQIKVTHQRR